MRVRAAREVTLRPVRSAQPNTALILLLSTHTSSAHLLRFFPLLRVPGLRAGAGRPR